MNDLLKSAIHDGQLWAYRRLASIKVPGAKFKANEKIFLKEVTLANIIGEANCFDRLINVLKAFPDLTRDDIEAELHFAVKELNNYVAEQIGRKDLKVSLEEILRTKGYYDDTTNPQ